MNSKKIFKIISIIILFLTKRAFDKKTKLKKKREERRIIRLYRGLARDSSNFFRDEVSQFNAEPFAIYCKTSDSSEKIC